MSVLKSIDPYSGDTLHTFQAISENEINDILIGSETAFQVWRNTSFEKRVGLFKKMSEYLKDKRSDLGKMITSEMGKPLKEAIAEIEKCAWVCEYYSENAEKFLKPRIIKTDAKSSYVSYEPLGVILAIMPWNFPFWQVFRFAVPTLMAGNTALLKHASNVPQCSVAIEKAFVQTGFPEGVFQSILVGSDKVEFILNANQIRAVSLTGSVGAGSKVAEQSGKLIKKTVLELGGSNAFIICDDADLSKAVDLAVKGRFMNTGQSCIASKRFIVMEKVYDEFRERFVEAVENLRSGDPNTDVDVGPMAKEDLAVDLEKQMNDSVNSGATILTGGWRRGAYFSPTVLENVKPGMPAFDEETFGPLAALIKANNIDEAISLSNKSKFGLGVTIITADPDRISGKFKDIEDGALFINDIVKSDPRLPFGGTKQSGYGRELSEEGILEFVNRKTIYIKN